MPKKSVLGHPENTPRLAREGFSLDQAFTFTASVGMLLPVWYDLLNPGETLKGSPSFLIRTENFLAPAMADIDCYCDVFFVPMQKILSSFGEWFYQINDIRSDYVDVSKLSEYIPFTFSQTNDKNPFSGMTKTAFESLLTSDTRHPGNVQRFDSFGFGLHRLLFHFGFNAQSIFFPIYDSYGWQDEAQQQSILNKFEDIQLYVGSPNFSPYWFAAYQGIYFDYYRNSEYQDNNIQAYNMDKIFADGSQELDMDTILNGTAGNARRGMFELRYRWRNKDYFMASRSTPLINGISMMPNYQQNLSRVNQWLTQGGYDLMDPKGQVGYDPDDPGYAFTQYGIKLNKTYHGVSSIPLYEDGQDWTPSEINTDSGSASDGSVVLEDGVFTDSDGSALRVQTRHTHNTTLTLNEVLSTARVRTMFALEKLARITQRSGKHYDDQTLAHFGFKVNKGLSGEVTRIASYHTMLGITKVTSTADTQGAALGEQAGVGFGILDGRKKKFKFTAPCHGIVMAIWSAAPRYKYIGAIDKLGFKTVLWDFYKPALDNLGSQPLFAFECNRGKSVGDGAVSTAVVGWQWRFMESKVKFDRVAPVFATVGKNPWSMVALPETPTYEGMVAPGDLNDLLNAQYDPAPLWPESGSQQDHVTSVTTFATKYLRDPFTIDFKMDCSKVSTMSTFGDVSLNGI